MAIRRRIDRTTQYARDVVSGRILAGRLVRLACQRHLRDLQEGAKRGLTFDKAAASRVFEFFEELRLPDALEIGQVAQADGAQSCMAGKPFHLEPSQAFIIGSLFGWKTRDGTRRFRTAYIEQGKGNGKTPLLAGIGLYGLTSDGEPAAEIYSAAAMKDQAKILFRDAENMVQVSPDLSAYIDSHVNNLSVDRTFSFFRPVSSENRGLDGKRVHMALIDELHVHPDATVVDKMRAGTKGRRQALIAIITNSGSGRHSVCWHYHELARKVLEGYLENDSLFAYVCQLDACAVCFADGKEAPVDGCTTCDDWRNPKVWIKSNPLLGVTITPRYLQEQVREAVKMPSKENMGKRLNFCLWTEQVTRWLPMSKWDACTAPVVREELRGLACMGGLDLASKIDLAAFVLVFQRAAGGYALLPFFWVPRDRAEERERTDHVPYLMWAQQGLIKMTDGNVIDYDVIFQDICDLAEQYRIVEIGYDSWNATQMAVQLSGQGFAMVDIPQTMRHLSEATKTFESLIVSGQLAHGGHPVLRWMASNAAVVRDTKDNLMLAKDRSTEKIDGIAASINGLSRWIRQDPEQPSVYETRGAITVG